MQTCIAGYDFTRSLALLGLVVANFSHSVDHTDFYLLHTLIQGGTIATFLVLGGIGVSLLAQRSRITNDAHGYADTRKRLVRRAAFLLVIGICCNVIWQASFLGLYSICIAIAVLLLTVSNRWLWSFTFIFALIWVVLAFLMFDYYEVIDEFDRHWKAFQEGDSWTIEGMVFRVFLYRFHLIFSWAAFLLIGMWIGRQDVHFRRVHRNVFFGGIVALVLAYAYWLLIRYVWIPSRPSLADLPSVSSVLLQHTPLDIFATFGITAVIIGGSLMLTEKYPAAKWTKPFIATGQLALTLYVIHLVIGMGLLKAKWLLEALRVLDIMLPYALGSAVIFCICAVIFSYFWRKRFERGPLEWTMRRITG